MPPIKKGLERVLGGCEKLIKLLSLKHLSFQNHWVAKIWELKRSSLPPVAQCLRIHYFTDYSVHILCDNLLKISKIIKSSTYCYGDW